MQELEEKSKGLIWLESALNGKPVSEFGAKLAALLDEWQRGIYHIQKEVLNKRVDWGSDRYIEIVLGGTLSTFDSDSLTRLVFLAHSYRIRVEIAAAAQAYLRLSFSPRQEKGGLCDRHPGLIEAVDSFTGLKHRPCGVARN